MDARTGLRGPVRAVVLVDGAVAAAAACSRAAGGRATPGTSVTLPARACQVVISATLAVACVAVPATTVRAAKPTNSLSQAIGANAAPFREPPKYGLGAAGEAIVSAGRAYLLSGERGGTKLGTLLGALRPGDAYDGNSVHVRWNNDTSVTYRIDGGGSATAHPCCS
ncbi:hypothetical protein NGB36_28845 [Streptomyces sp. RB6PN25]|uniref:Uncharacterized protein n=1 Tax=Streptomyces humicola TaxID=2953240 RepID=A0ABT1Q567_9ACTN|nr:hypothetical protein [Streptomyces humicola]MCQ4084475.1 hypothetical protein [Streptomyces humicola]